MRDLELGAGMRATGPGAKKTGFSKHGVAELTKNDRLQLRRRQHDARRKPVRLAILLFALPFAASAAQGAKTSAAPTSALVRAGPSMDDMKRWLEQEAPHFLSSTGIKHQTPVFSTNHRGHVGVNLDRCVLRWSSFWVECHVAHFDDRRQCGMANRDANARPRRQRHFASERVLPDRRAELVRACSESSGRRRNDKRLGRWRSKTPCEFHNLFS